MMPNRPVLMCKQKVNFVGRWRGVIIDDSCGHFCPSSTCKAGSRAGSKIGSKAASKAGSNIGSNIERRIPLTQGKYAIVDADEYYQLSRFTWFAINSNKTFYAARAHRGTTVKMHRVIVDAPGHLVVDHIDRNGLNNCKSNLRVCTNAQNILNAGARGKGLSKYKGVSRHARGKKWVSVIQLNKKTHYLGYFNDEIEAAKAYDKKASQLHGEFACLNFPPSAES